MPGWREQIIRGLAVLLLLLALAAWILIADYFTPGHTWG